MNSILKKEMQDGVDAVFELVGGCHFAMVIDLETALVLCANSAANLSQDTRNHLASEACKVLDFPSAEAFEEIRSIAAMHSVTCFDADGIVVSIKKTGIADVALVCQFEALPDRSDLYHVANDVLGLFQSAEAV